MDPRSVITLGHKLKQPLIGPSGELSYRLEPHGLIYYQRLHARTMYSGDRQWGGVPGVVRPGGY